MALRELLAFFKVDVDSRKLSQVDEKIDAAKRNTEGFFEQLGSLQTAFLGMGAVVAVQRLAGYVQETLNAADATLEAADALGVSIEEFQTFESFASTSGSSAEEMSGAMRVLARNAESGAAEFADLGVKVKNADGSLKGLGEITEQTLIGLAGLEDSTKRVALAQKLLGRGGASLLPGLGAGREGVEQAIQAAKDLGVVFDRDMAESASAANDEIFYLTRQWQGLRATLVKLALPAIRQGVAWTIRAIRSTREWASTHSGLLLRSLRAGGLTAFIGVLGNIVSRFGGIRGVIQKLMPFVNRLLMMFLRFALPALILEDFFGFLEGKDSLIGRILKEFGLIDDTVAAGKELKKVIVEWIPSLRNAAKGAVRFFTEVLIGLGALVGMWSNAGTDMGDDFESLFMKNTRTIFDFFSWLGSFVPNNLFTPWQWGVQMIIGIWTWCVAAVIGLVQGVAGTLVGQFTGAVAAVGAIVAWLVSWIDALFGTNLAGAVLSATGNIVSAFTGAWQSASDGLSELIAKIEGVGQTIQDVITSPLTTLPNLFAGTTDADISAMTREQNARSRAAARARSERAGNVTQNNTTNVTVTAPSNTPAATARAAGGAVTKANRDNLRTLGAVR